MLECLLTCLMSYATGLAQSSSGGTPIWDQSRASRIPEWVKNIYECLRIDHDSVTMAKIALRICYELTTIFFGIGSSWLKLWTVQNFCHEFPNDQNSLRIYTKLVGTSQTDNDSTTNPENCQFLEICGIRGRSVIGVLGA